MATIPPWLDVTPGQHLQAAEAGARLGLERTQLDQQAAQAADRMSLARDQMANQAAESVADYQLKAGQMKIQLAKFLQDNQQQQLENQLAVDKHTREQNRADQELAINKSYKDQTIAINQAKVAETTKRNQLAFDVAARKYSAQLQAQREIDAGHDPADVYLRYGAILGETGSSLAALNRQVHPKTPADLGEATEADIGGQKWLQIPKATGGFEYRAFPKQANETMAPQVKARLSVINSDMRSLEKRMDLLSNNGATIPPEGTAMRKQFDALGSHLETLRKERDTIAPPVGGAAVPEAAPADAGTVIKYDRNGNRIGGAPAAAAPAQEGQHIVPQAAPAAAPAPAPAAKPTATLPGTTPAPQAQLPSGMDEVMRSLRFGKGFQTKSEKEVLRNIVTNLDLGELARKAKKYGLNADASSWDGNTIRVDSEELGSKSMSRGQLEQAVYDAAIKQGWE